MNAKSVFLVGFAAIAGAMLLPVSSAHAVWLTGVPDNGHNSEYLFGFSGGSPNTLTLNGGSAVLSTAVQPLGLGNNQGWWSGANTWVNSEGNDNYFVGDLSNNGSQLLNNFFTFYIGNLSGPVNSAVLDVQRYDGFSSLGAVSHTYRMFDVSTPEGTLNNTVGFSAAIYNDLGSGVSYGTHVITVAGLSTEILHLALTAGAVADLNAAIARGDRYFSVGGTLTPGGAAVPEAGTTLAMLGMVTAALGFLRRNIRN